MKLGLPFSELQILYTRHLILKEFLVTDVSLYILSLLFQYKKQQAFNVYNQDNKNQHKSLLYLEVLEDRFVNGEVLYRIAYCKNDINIFEQAFNIFKSQKTLSPQELFYMAAIYDKKNNDDEAIRFYKLSGENGHIKSFINLGYIYRERKNYDIAIMYYEKAISHPNGKSHLAYMLELGLGIKNIKRSHELYIDAAKNNDEYAINRCKTLHLIF
jgi:TPR repeat protein